MKINRDAFLLHNPFFKPFIEIKKLPGEKKAGIFFRNTCIFGKYG